MTLRTQRTTDDQMPGGLRFSERKLWDECPQARTVLRRLARYRKASLEQRIGLGEARSVTEAACECENASRISYTGRDDKLHCGQCDGLWPDA